MNPDDQHPQYADMKSVWQTCRDASTGQRAIHKATTRYLPRLGGQSDDEYTAYLKRALYMNATGRTVEAMVGLVFRKRPTLSKGLDDYKADINMSGLSLAGFAQESIAEVIEVGRAGVMVDYPPIGNDESGRVLTIGQSKQMGLRPYLTLYKAEAILNWAYGRVNNATVLVQVFLLETGIDKSGAEVRQVRELFLDAGAYKINIWQESKKDGWVKTSTIAPTMRGVAITEIPFFFMAPKEGNGDIQNPPIEDLAYVNIAHYMNSADLENGAHISGLPTPWINGIDDPASVGDLHLGSGTVIKLPKDSSAGFLQCGSEGFATLEKAMDRKEQQMSALGARMLAPEKREAEAEGTHEIKRGGENSVLATIAGSVDSSLTAALKFMLRWDGKNESDDGIVLNKDYIPAQIDPAMLREMVAAHQAGAYSFETLWYMLQQGEIVPESRSAQDERDIMADEPPALGTMNDDS